MAGLHRLTLAGSPEAASRTDWCDPGRSVTGAAFIRPGFLPMDSPQIDGPVVEARRFGAKT